MAYTGFNTSSCCTPCSGTETVQVPGPTGPTGADGADGQDGVNAYSYVTTQFLMPETVGNPGNTTSIAVSDSSWMAVGQVLYIQNAGYVGVVAIPSTNTITISNLENLVTGAYSDNAVPTTAIPVSSKVSPGGVQGPNGPGGSNAVLCPDNGKYYIFTPVIQDGIVTGEWIEVV